MAKTNKILDKGIKMIQRATIDDIVTQLDNLNISEQEKIKVTTFLFNILEGKQTTSRVAKRKAPIIPDDKQ